LANNKLDSEHFKSTQYPPNLYMLHRCQSGRKGNTKLRIRTWEPRTQSASSTADYGR